MHSNVTNQAITVVIYRICETKSQNGEISPKSENKRKYNFMRGPTSPQIRNKNTNCYRKHASTQPSSERRGSDDSKPTQMTSIISRNLTQTRTLYAMPIDDRFSNRKGDEGRGEGGMEGPGKNIISRPLSHHLVIPYR